MMKTVGRNILHALPITRRTHTVLIIILSNQSAKIVLVYSGLERMAADSIDLSRPPTFEVKDLIAPKSTSPILSTSRTIPTVLVIIVFGQSMKTVPARSGLERGLADSISLIAAKSNLPILSTTPRIPTALVTIRFGQSMKILSRFAGRDGTRSGLQRMADSINLIATKNSLRDLSTTPKIPTVSVTIRSW